MLFQLDMPRCRFRWVFRQDEQNMNHKSKLNSMSAPLVRKAYRRDGIVSLAGLSQRFDVSEQAIAIRLRELRLAP